MDDDEFFKELEEVSKEIEKEYANQSKTKENNTSSNITFNTNTQNLTNSLSGNNNVQPQPQLQPNNSNNMPNFNDPSQINFANLFNGFNYNNDEANINNIKQMFANFNDNDPESQELLKKISK